MNHPTASPAGGISRRHLLRSGLALAGAAAVATPIIGYDIKRHRPQRPLQLGDRGPAVHEIQIQVAGWASDVGDLTTKRFLPITGVYDKATAAAVRRFQQGYELDKQTGRVDEATRTALAKLVQADGSTAHFSWVEMLRNDPGHKVTPAIRENTRRMMFKLEALRRKLNDVEITIKIAYKAGAADEHETQIGDDRFHALGGAVDFTAFAVRPRARWYQCALTCGFTGLGPIVRHWQHCDSRLELASSASETPWFPDGAG